MSRSNKFSVQPDTDLDFDNDHDDETCNGIGHKQVVKKHMHA